MELEHVGPFEQSFVARRSGSLRVTRAEATVYPLADGKSRQIGYHEQMGVKTIGFHVSEYKPHYDSDTHRHLCEVLMYVIEGEGHAIIDGERVDWKAQDAICIPPNAWHSLHAHDAPVRMVAIWNIPLMEALGLFYFEPVPDESGDARAGAGKAVYTGATG